MPDLSTEPRMMRSQQDKDTPEQLSEDETRGETPRTDVDSRDSKDREASKTGEARYETEQMDAIFEGNQKSGKNNADGGEERTAATTAKQGEAGLGNKGRSLLGD